MPSEPAIPTIPFPGTLDPLLTLWPVGQVLYRVHKVKYSPNAFNPGQGRGRFHPFPDNRGKPVPTLYGSDQVDGALAETVFRGVPAVGALRGIRRQALAGVVLSVLAPARALKLADLRGHGLRRLGLKRNQLLETEADRYPETAAWAQALHHSSPVIDGLIWISRQFDTASVMMLFGDRVTSRILKLVTPPLTLYRGRGFDEVQRVVETAGLVILE